MHVLQHLENVASSSSRHLEVGRGADASNSELLAGLGIFDDLFDFALIILLEILARFGLDVDASWLIQPH